MAGFGDRRTLTSAPVCWRDDEAETLTRLEKAGRHFLADLGYDLGIGAKVGEDLRRRLATRMAHVLFDAVTGGSRRGAISMSLRPWPIYRRLMASLFSGGVSEYIYSREASVFGDLGPYLVKKSEKKPRSVASKSLTLAKAFALP